MGSMADYSLLCPSPVYSDGNLILLFLILETFFQLISNLYSVIEKGCFD